jgi:hypothetical protein
LWKRSVSDMGLSGRRRSIYRKIFRRRRRRRISI